MNCWRLRQMGGIRRDRKRKKIIRMCELLLNFDMMIRRVDSPSSSAQTIKCLDLEKKNPDETWIAEQLTPLAINSPASSIRHPTNTTSGTRQLPARRTPAS
jgi:hypothetical protein